MAHCSRLRGFHPLGGERKAIMKWLELAAVVAAAVLKIAQILKK